jgi:hypothetical protein
MDNIALKTFIDSFDIGITGIIAVVVAYLLYYQKDLTNHRFWGILLFAILLAFSDFYIKHHITTNQENNQTVSNKINKYETQINNLNYEIQNLKDKKCNCKDGRDGKDCDIHLLNYLQSKITQLEDKINNLSLPASRLKTSEIIAGGICVNGRGNLWDYKYETFGGAQCINKHDGYFHDCVLPNKIAELKCPSNTKKIVTFGLSNCWTGGEGAICVVET